jgi:hypothetical protein
MKNRLTFKSVSCAVAISLLVCATLVVQSVHAGEEPETAFPYEDYARMLSRYVDDEGMVDYKRLKANRRPLDRFVRSLGRLDRATYRGWTEDQKVAFLTNAYNAITLKIIIDNYPIKAGWFGSLRWPKNSIRQIDGVFDGIEHRVMGPKMTLDDIEHETLRKEFTEPRIHLTLVCAAMSCPRLLDEPYVGHRLDEQFKLQARDFVRQEDNFRIDRGDDRVGISSIFKWFGEDFIPTHRTETHFTHLSKKKSAVLNYLKDHVSDRDRRYLLGGDYDVKYIDYDWSLNEQ